ncbi:MAG: cellulase family glycosylhydrolase, partial [Bacteroidaceae bacterium]|nr:cellulase family glycosylhydrolase [Bacteroidaceae bacterium]
MAVVACSLSLPAMAQIVAYGKLQPIHVDGNYLKDPFGNKVVLHGVMDTPSPYFNNYRWGGSATSSTAQACVNYFNKLFTAITDSTQGAYCNLFRLHLDPCWTNNSDNSYAGWTQDSRESGTGEANITRYDPRRLKTYMKSVYWRIAQQALKKGLYVIMRPPGVCPGDIYVGGSYQQYLLNVWDIVTQNDSVLKYCGQVGIELANEPVGLHNADGSDSDSALRDFFQPIVDKIRENGFKGIIWVPGTGWQSNYRAYAKYPITGDQIGYAVHDYVGWYSTDDNSYDHATAIKSFGEAVPVVWTNPVVITEVDWSPYKEGTGHYNEHGQWVLSNYGTWATGSTSKWGHAYKAMLDYYGNISMTLSGTACYIDIDSYINNKEVVPAFKTAMEANGVNPYEASGVACFQWYAAYAKENYPFAERYQPVQEIPENPFDFTKGWFNPTILYENTASVGTLMTTLSLKKAGCAGWRFEEDEGLDISGYNYL